jgi:hypothetical protein
MRFARLTLFALILLCVPVFADAQLSSGVLDPSRAIDWTQIGAGSIPSGSWTQCGATIAPYGSIISPQSSSTINNAITSCAANHYVLLGPGTFYLSDKLVMGANNVVLRGSGPDKTVLRFYGGGSCWIAATLVCFNGGSSMDLGGTGSTDADNLANWTAGYARGTTSITIGANTRGSHKPAVGDTILLDMQVDGTALSADTYPEVFSCIQAGQCSQSAGSPPSGHGSGASSYEQFQVVQITSISASACPCTVGITPGLFMPNYRSGNNPTASWSNLPTRTGAGIEDLRIQNVAGGIYGITTLFTTKSWIKDVQMDTDLSVSAPLVRFFVHGFGSLNNTVRDSYIFAQTSYSDIYGSDDRTSCGTLYENNIFQSIDVPFENEQSCANVYSYNYIIHNITAGGWLQPGFNNHGGGFNFTLVEGNDALGTGWDNYFGGGNFNTVFRNRLWGYQPGPLDLSTDQTYPGSNYAMYRFSNWVGNVMGYVGYHTNYQVLANDGSSSATCEKSIWSIGLGGNCQHNTPAPDDQHTVDTLMRWGNWDAVNNSVQWNSTEVPSGLAKYANAVPSSHNLPVSFLYAGKPSWWTVNGQVAIPWPAIGPDVTSGSLANSGGFANKIPARVCFERVMNGTYGDLIPKTFNANSCYGNAASTNQIVPTGLAASVQ